MFRKLNVKDLEIGGIYRTNWDIRPLRIIGLDDIEVFYDCLWSDNKWTFSGNFKRQCSFYRTSSLLFAEKSNKLEFKPLSDEEKKFFRPDLLMRVCRIMYLSWNNIEQKGFSEFDDFIRANTKSEVIDQILETNELIVKPIGPEGRLKKGRKLVADNAKFFTVPELIWKSNIIQESANSNRSTGIGLYRIGFEKGLPSYYIGEYFDKAGLLKK